MPIGSPQVTGSASTPTADAAIVTILVVCTANICRSPMAEGLLRKRLESAPRFVVSSGGFLPGGRAVDPFAARAMAALNIDVDKHRSRQLNPEVLRRASLIITMTSDHVRQAVDMAPQSWPRLFSLSDLAGRMSAVGPRREGEEFADYVGRLHFGRTAAAAMSAMSAGATGDIADPYGESLSAFERTALQLDRYSALVASSILGVAVPDIRGQTGTTPTIGPASPRRTGIFRRKS